MLSQIRWVVVFLPVGIILAAIGGGFSLANPTFVSGSGLILGMIFVLLGLALKSAELSPVPMQASTDVEAVRSQATATQIQILKDVTRYQYGPSVHLEPALERLGIASEEDEHPQLIGIREAVVENAYGLILIFWSPDFTIEQWQEKEDQMTRFFGPGVQVHSKALENSRVELAIVAV